jgi:hypothetical protein
MKTRPAKRDDRAKLLARQRELRQELEMIENTLAASREDTSKATRIAAPANGSSSRSGRPVREAVLDALHDLGWMAYSRELALYIKATTDREILPTRFGSLGKDEQRAFESRRPAPVFLCYGLTSLRFEPIKRLLARSDWPLSRRIVAPTTGRVQHLRMTARLCELAVERAGAVANPEMLKIIAADHARDLPGIKFRRGVFELELWKMVAEQQLDSLAMIDEANRAEAAARLAQLDERDQLFGPPELSLFAVPGKDQTAEGGDP